MPLECGAGIRNLWFTTAGNSSSSPIDVPADRFSTILALTNLAHVVSSQGHASVLLTRSRSTAQIHRRTQAHVAGDRRNRKRTAGGAEKGDME